MPGFGRSTMVNVKGEPTEKVLKTLSTTTLALPIFQGLTEAEQIDVVGAIAQFVR